MAGQGWFDEKTLRAMDEGFKEHAARGAWLRLDGPIEIQVKKWRELVQQVNSHAMISDIGPGQKEELSRALHAGLEFLGILEEMMRNGYKY